MKKLLAFALVAMMAGAALAETGWMNSYVYVWDGSADTYYNLNGADQPEDFNGADLGTFELTSTLFLNSQINAWANGGDSYNYMSLYWRIGTSGAFTEQQDNALDNIGGNDWRAITPGVDLIAAAGGAGSYVVQVYAERSHSWGGGGPYVTQLDVDGDTGGGAPDNFFQASFDINPAPVPEPATMSLLGLGALALALRRKMSK
ncbi:MAG: PEP-CTERM sorting domain-containing protein [Kiritimatiellae bacterium]|nr:PEP-CTERM sorting domain-containing protein [Kiritimatiellia bacterium]